MSANTQGNVTSPKTVATPEIHDYHAAYDGAFNSGIPGTHIGAPVMVIDRADVAEAIETAEANDPGNDPTYNAKKIGMRKAKASGVIMFLHGAHYAEDRGEDLGEGIMVELREYDAAWRPTGDVIMAPAESIAIYISRPEGYKATSKADPRKAIASTQKARIVAAAKKWNATFDADQFAADVTRLSGRHAEDDAFKTALRAHVDSMIDAIRPVDEKAKAAPSKRVIVTSVASSPLAKLLFRAPTPAQKTDAREKAKALAS